MAENVGWRDLFWLSESAGIATLENKPGLTWCFSVFAFTGFSALDDFQLAVLSADRPNLVFLLCVALVPETYAPVLLRKRAAKLTKETGKKHLSQFDANRPPSQGLGAAFKIALTRPFAMLFKEPICLAWALYAAFIYGLLYLFFVAYPIVYQRGRGWSAGIG